MYLWVILWWGYCSIWLGWKFVSKQISWEVMPAVEDDPDQDQRLLAHRPSTLASGAHISAARRTEYRPHPVLWWLMVPTAVSEVRISRALFAEISKLWNGTWKAVDMENALLYAGRVTTIHIPRNRYRQVKYPTCAYFRDWCTWQLQLNRGIPDDSDAPLSSFFELGPPVNSAY